MLKRAKKMCLYNFIKLYMIFMVYLQIFVVEKYLSARTRSYRFLVGNATDNHSFSLLNTLLLTVHPVLLVMQLLVQRISLT